MKPMKVHCIEDKYFSFFPKSIINKRVNDNTKYAEVSNKPLISCNVKPADWNGYNQSINEFTDTAYKIKKGCPPVKKPDKRTKVRSFYYLTQNNTN